MSRPKILFFDLGDTIITSRNGEPFHYEDGFGAVLERATANPHRIMPGTLAEEYLAYEEERRVRTPGGILDLTMEIPFSTALRHLCGRHGITLGIPWEEAAEIYWRHRTRYDPCEGVGELFRFLGKRGIRAAMITNNMFQDTIIRRRLDEIAPDVRFEFILSSADVASAKPDPRLFRIALETAGVAPGDAWHAGDSVSNDVMGAAAAGIFPVWYTRYVSGRHAVPPEIPYLRAESWRDLAAAIETADQK